MHMCRSGSAVLAVMGLALTMALGCEELERVFAMHVERMARSRGKGGRGATER